jgi:hypothetical protein
VNRLQGSNHVPYENAEAHRLLESGVTQTAQAARPNGRRAVSRAARRPEATPGA